MSRKPAAHRATGSNRPPRRGLTRRRVLAGLTGLPLAGASGLAALGQVRADSHEERQLGVQLAMADAAEASAAAGSARKPEPPKLDGLKGQVPHAKIGKLELSRMILGGNLIGGWAHARDLIYASDLVKAYHTREKIFETLRIAEGCGVNTILTNPLLCEVINDYWKNGGGKIQFISDCGGQNVLEMAQKSIDNGACACYIQGGVADGLVAAGQFDLMQKVLDLTRRNGLPAGIGGHALATVTASVEKGLEPDFWMKTLHTHNYWSADLQPEHDNVWCKEPQQTIAFMKELPQPWIAFKVLGAGALRPEEGFAYAFQNGADFICVGMYDFQVVGDVNILLGVLGGKIERARPWRA